MKIEELDPNFKTAEIGGNTLIFRDSDSAPFVTEGFAWRKRGGVYTRVPETMSAEDASAAVLRIALQTSGGAVRFRTNSAKIALRAKLHESYDMPHMPHTGSSGFDLMGRHSGQGEYAHAGTVRPLCGQLEVESLFSGWDAQGFCDWIVNFPLYGGVLKLEIGVEPGAELLPPLPHRLPHPILFYGSSITQGGCASRPGNSYASMLCRALDAEQINLGFSGNGKGETGMAKLISSLPLSALVLDYDYNAPSVEHLQKTHETFFRIIREKLPELPVLFLSKPDVWDFWRRHNGNAVFWREREAVVRTTYEHAVSAGDRHVAFLPGDRLFGNEDRSFCTVDGTHPNDLGFYRMYQSILPVLKELL